MKNNNILESDFQSLINTAFQNHQSGKLDEAESLYRQLLSTQPDQVTTANELRKLDHLVFTDFGNLLLKQNKLDEAIYYYQEAIKINPEFVDSYNNLGMVFKQQGKFKEAIYYCQEAIKINPEFSLARQNLATIYNNLGNQFKKQGKVKEAGQYYQQAIKFDPNCAESYNNLANILRELNNLEKAKNLYQKALKINPNLAAAHKNLASTLREQGKLEEANLRYEEALRINPDFADAEFGLCINQIPIVHSSIDEINLRRNNYQKYLQNLTDRYQKASQEQQANAASGVGVLQPFYLTYQGLNNRDLQQNYGELICQLMSSRYPQWSNSLPIPHLKENEKIRIGFVSGFFRQHSNWKIPIKGWVENLDKNKFDLFGYYTNIKQDNYTANAAKAFLKFIQGPLSVETWCEAIKQDNLHVLIFPEFGMDPLTLKLGCLRLAPIQMTSWGHPDTSGLPTIDYYLSSDLMEPDNAQDHYTEKLVRLPNLSIHYNPLYIEPKAISKKDIGIENDEVMFWCCQSLYKYLPQHDDIFPIIAEELGNCKFVFIRHKSDASEKVSDVFYQRLNDAFGKFGLNYEDCCIFLPPLGANLFAGVTAIADVFLDSIGWSGCNSSLEAIAHNIPLVTLPGDLMRGRHTMAILKMMGIEETIAKSKDDYVKIAVRLGQDAQYRQHLSNQIAQNKHKLYGDLEPVRALEELILKTISPAVSS